MIFAKDNSWAFVHVPRCGGTWVQVQIERSGIGTTNYKDENGNRIRRGGHDWPEGNPMVPHRCSIDPGYLLGRGYEGVPVPKDTKVFATVRDPASWYLSYYNLRKGMDFRGKTFPIDRIKHDMRKVPSFEGFVHWMVAEYSGYLGRVYKQMLGDRYDFIWKQSHLREGLHKALGKVGVEIEITNERENQSFSYATMTDELKALIEHTEPIALEYHQKAWPHI